MGDRANVIVKSAGEQVCLYTHWSGTELPKTLQAALRRGRNMWSDSQYLTRIIFSQMVPASERLRETGFGISQEPHDGEDRILVVDTELQTVSGANKPKMSFEAYVAENFIPSWEEPEED